MTSLKLEKTIRPADLGHYDIKLHRAYNLSISFAEGTRIQFDYAVPKVKLERSKSDESKWHHITNDPKEFISAHRNGKTSNFGMIWHDYCADIPIRTKDGVIGLWLHDCFKKPTVELSKELAEQLLRELERS